MATPEQVQELVARIQAMEAREADGLARASATEHGARLDVTTCDDTTASDKRGTRCEYFLHGDR
eukprot:5509186-Amphidinium_carterae.1